MRNCAHKCACWAMVEFGYTECPGLCDAYAPMVDVDALKALAKVLHDMGNQYDAHKRYELGTTFRSIAARIREALGVQDA